MIEKDSFQDYKDQIADALEKILNESEGAKGNYSLIHGFVTTHVTPDGENIKNIPQVAVVNTDTAEVMYFSLFALLPELKERKETPELERILSTPLI